MIFDDFISAIRAMVEGAGIDGCFVVEKGVYKRGHLTVSITENNNKAIVSYVANPSHGGHSSSASLPYDLTAEGVRRAASDVCDKLNNRYLYE